MNTQSQIEKLELELEKVRLELLKFRTTQNELEIIRKEKQYLEKILQYQQSLPYTSKPAKVIGKDPQNFFNTLTINKGTRHGIRVGFPVIGFTEEGYALIGKIFRIEQTTSQVITLLDPRCQVGVLLEETGDTGIMKGKLPTLPLCQIEFIDRHSKISEGMKVVTSGMGEKYPSGIPVGRVSQVLRENYGLFQSSTVSPDVNFFKITDVFIFSE